MHKRIIDEAALPRIRGNISKLFPKILAIANPVFVKSRLPDFPGKLLPNLMRKSALDALGAAFNRLAFGWGQQNMQMLWHYNEAMQLVASLIPIVEERLHQQLGICRYSEQRASLVGRGGERIGFHGRLRKAYLRG